MYRLKHSFHDGATHVVLDPMDLIARLAAPEVSLATATWMCLWVSTPTMSLRTGSVGEVEVLVTDVLRC